MPFFPKGRRGVLFCAPIWNITRKRRRGGPLRPPVPRCGTFPHSSRRGGACPSRHVSGMAMARRRGGSQTRPSSADHDTYRSRRLTGFRPAGRPPLPAAAKEAKRRRGCPAVALWLQRCHPRTPGIYGGPILGGYRSLSGAGGTTTDPASAPLPLSLYNQDGLDSWTKRARLMAQGLISAGRNRRAGPRRRGLHIPRFAQKGKARSFHRSASPTQTRFAWLCVGGRLRRPLWTNRCPSVPHLLPRLAGTSAEGRRGIPRKRGSGGERTGAGGNLFPTAM